MNNTVFMIFTNHNTQFGPFSSKNAAQEAKSRLATTGDSIGMIWKRNATRITECKEWQDHKGFITYEPIS